MNKFEITFDEQYQLIKLYDLLRDTGMIEDLPNTLSVFGILLIISSGIYVFLREQRLKKSSIISKE